LPWLTRYRGRIQAYQVWNEPNLGREWGERTPNAAEYVELLEGMLHRDQDGRSGGDCDLGRTGADGGRLARVIPDERFLQEMYEAGAASYFDMLGRKRTGYKAPPEVSPEEAADTDLGWGGHRTFAFRHVEDIRAIMVANGDAEKQIAILEMGWTTDPRPDSPYHWHAVTEAQQATIWSGVSAMRQRTGPGWG
jgi:polysaccharide biosynthesis protein PslG